MCLVRVVKRGFITEEDSFAVRMHKPLAFAMDQIDAFEPCSCWIIFCGDALAVQNRLGFGGRSAPVEGNLPF